MTLTSALRRLEPPPTAFGCMHGPTIFQTTESHGENCYANTTSSQTETLVACIPRTDFTETPYMVGWLRHSECQMSTSYPQVGV
jgi:hypothetical protein